MTAVAIIALLVNVATVVANLRVTNWRRRAGNVNELRAILDEIAPVVDEDSRPEAILNLWAPALASRLQELIEEQDRHAGRRLRQQITAFHAAMMQVRGMAQPTAEEMAAGAGATLTPAQKSALREARQLLSDIRGRLNKISRHSG